MTGLKSGSGDDLWGDDSDDGEAETPDGEASDSAAETGSEAGNGLTSDEPSSTGDRSDAGSSDDSRDGDDDEDAGEASADSSSAATEDPSTDQPATTDDDAESALDASSIDVGSSSRGQPYIVRRAIQDKSVQFERDERLTFFVHDDVADGERDLITDLETSLGRDLPKFDVREAVYRAALRNPEAVLEELLAMGYSVDEE